MTPRAYRFRLDLELVDLEDTLGGNVDAAFTEACKRFIAQPSSVLGADIEYFVTDKREDVLKAWSMRQALGTLESTSTSTEPGES